MKPIRITLTKSLRFTLPLLLLACASLCARAGDFAPEGAPFGTVVKYSGTSVTTEGEESPEDNTLRILSPTQYDGGTYTYTKTGENTATVTFHFETEDDFDGEIYQYVEDGTLTVRFETEYGGTYASSGTFTDTLGFEDGYTTDYTGSGSFILAHPLTFQATALPAAKLNRNYRKQFVASGGTEQSFWRLVRGKLPAGLRLDSKGLISGRARKVGAFPLTIQVSNELGQSVRRAMILKVTKR